MKKIVVAASFLMLAPVVVFGQELDNVRRLIESVRDIIDVLIPLVAALALLYFFYGLAKFILNNNNEDAHEEGKRIMIWGIVALFVIVSVWGLVRFVGNALGINPSSVDQPIPGIGN